MVGTPLAVHHDRVLTMSLQMLPRPPGCEGRVPGRGHPLQVALAALVAALVLLVADCAGGPEGSDPASLPDQPGVEERSTSTKRAVSPSNSPALRTRPVQRRTSPQARARCASCNAFQRQPS